MNQELYLVYHDDQSKKAPLEAHEFIRGKMSRDFTNA
jgi:hypothetical protein